MSSVRLDLVGTGKVQHLNKSDSPASIWMLQQTAIISLATWRMQCPRSQSQILMADCWQHAEDKTWRHDLD